MSTKDNIIFYVIVFVVISIVIVPLYVEKHWGGDGSDEVLVGQVMTSQSDETHKERNSVIDNITANIIIAIGTIIIAIGTLVSILHGLPTYREKMRKYRINQLKDRMLILFSKGWNSQSVHTPETLNGFFDALGPKFQEEQYQDLHQTAFDELGREGKNPIWRAWDLKRQVIEEQMVQRAKAGMPGPDGMVYRGGGRIIRDKDS